MSYAPQNSAAPMQITPLCKPEDQTAPCIEVFRPAGTVQEVASHSSRAEDEGWRWLLGTMTEGFAVCELIYDSAGLPVDFRYLEANAAFEPTFGFKQGSVVGHSALELIPSLDLVWVERFAKISKEGGAETFEYWSTRQHRWFRLGAFSKGHGKFMMAVQDLTGQRHLEGELRREKERFELLVENSLDLICELDSRGNYLYLSPNYRQLLGYGPSELFGRNRFGFIHPDDVALVKTKQALNGGQAVFRYRHKDGTWRWLESTAGRYQTPEGETHTVLISRDITEQKLKTDELRWKTAFLEAQVDAALDAILVVDDTGRRILQNQRLVSLFNVPDEIVQDIDDAKLLRHVVGKMKDQEAFATRVKYLYDHPDEEGRDELEMADGRILDRYSAPVRDAGGKYYGRIWAFRDVTKEKLMDKQLLRSQRMESIGTLASGVAHDLNNILAPILMAATMLAERLEPADAPMAKAIEQSAQRGADIVKQVLTFARGIEGERISLQPRHLIKEIEQIAHETFPRSIAIRDQAPKDLWLVTGDSTQLHQVLLNLCINARDAMPDGGTLKLTAENLEIDEAYATGEPDAKPGKYVLISVSDSGTGIPAGIIEKIFDPFFTTKGVEKGTGLGLSTVIGIVKGHGGFVKVYSEIGKGSTFNIYLPASQSQSAETQAPERIALPHGNGECILLAEDEAAIRNVTVTLLERAGYKVLTATDGIEALAIYAKQSERISLLLTDAMMPNLDGIALMRAVRMINPAAKIVACTGQIDEARQAELNRLGIQTILRKPYSHERLLVALHQEMAGSNA